MDELIAAAQAGRGAVAVLEGAAGIGKTALLGEAARRAERAGLAVLRAGGALLEQEYPFGVVRQAFARVVARGHEGGDLFEGAAELAQVPLGLGLRGGQEAGVEGAGAAMHGLYWLTANLAERGPLLLAVDDAHWADEMSLRFVVYLARRVRELPVLLLVAARPPLRDGPLAGLAGLDGVTWLRPAPLEESEVARLLAAEGVPVAGRRFVAACHEASGGNPFLVGELLAAVRAEAVGRSQLDAAGVVRLAPQGVVRWVLARVRALGEDAVRLASAFAVLGSGAALADAALLAGLDRPAAAVAADALIAAEILGAERGYRFVHPLLASAIEDGLPPAAKAEAHARAARLAAERGARTAEVAAHLLASAPARDDWVVETLCAAAGEAQASGAPGSAAAYLERALEERPAGADRAELLLRLGEAQLQAGRGTATERLRQAVEASPDPRRRAAIRLTLGRALFLTGDDMGAREAMRAGLAERPGADDDLARELGAWYVSLAPGAAGAPTAEREWPRRLLEDDALGRTRAERRALAHLAYEAARSGALPHDAVARLALRALAGGALLHDSLADVAPYTAACIALSVAGRPAAVIGELDRAIELSQRRGSAVAFRWFSLIRGMAHGLRGDLLNALVDLESAREAYSDGYDHELPGTLALLALCLIERGDLTGAAAALRLPGDQTRWRAQFSIARYLYALGRFQAATGSLREALQTLLDGGEAATRMNFSNPAANFGWRSEAALLAARLGEADRAAELVAEELRLARAFGAPHALGIALRAAGLIDGGDRGLELLAEAVTVLNGSDADLELARTLIDQGAALRRAGRRRDAREPLRRGLDVASRCGALVLAARAREELVAAGGRPRRERISGTDGLTASELRVARLAAQGLTKRQIAQALFVSMSTVSTHLGHVYAKLDINHRDQLPSALAGEQGQAA
jgi:DNA-binding CsgD family transcriptional regulator